MNASKKKTYGVLIGVGLAALIADRILRSGGPPASAQAGGAAIVAAAEVPAQGATPALGVAVTPFPRELPHVAPDIAPRDPFQIPAAMRNAIQTVAIADLGGSESEDAEKVSPSQALQSARRLSAIIAAGDSRLAIIDDKVMSVGQVLDDCRLKGVQTRSVLFECPDGEVFLQLQDPLLESVRH